MGLINRYKLGALAEKQLNMQAKRFIALEGRGKAGPKYRAKIVAKTITKENHFRAQQVIRERNHLEKKVFKEARKKKLGGMSRSRAAQIAALARWHGGTSGGHVR